MKSIVGSVKNGDKITVHNPFLPLIPLFVPQNVFGTYALSNFTLFSL